MTELCKGIAALLAVICSFEGWWAHNAGVTGGTSLLWFYHNAAFSG